MKQKTSDEQKQSGKRKVQAALPEDF